MSSTHLDPIERQLIKAHIDSGQPRYSIVLKLAGGGFIRSWTSDRGAALVQHAHAAAEPTMILVITFDHLDLETVATTVPPHGKTPDQLRTECDVLIDRLIGRWTQEARH